MAKGAVCKTANAGSSPARWFFCVNYIMGLEKAILHGKEKRKPYRYSQRFDYSCRNHGSCPWCLHNRTHSHRKNKLICLEKIKEFNNEWKNRQD